ncbi:hypothetical protein N7520_001610 [Penicillium odoratum]|uniref:uncharacterized protein n=1 Tax=Penicillium odoratum TaxID=1167516 RepID=UPI002546C9E4|nr:uncharacterized protein N7520_001610 [Penicillium odoratum]KAJ5778364.1 hypothetical protein N7520_001610 [Penicillium odoratum]
MASRRLVVSCITIINSGESATLSEEPAFSEGISETTTDLGSSIPKRSKWIDRRKPTDYILCSLNWRSKKPSQCRSEAW